MGNPWIVGVDFNTLLLSDEKIGGLPPDPTSMTDFNEFIFNTSLNHLPFIGNLFTLSNMQVGGANQQSRLDRVLANHDWLDLAHSSSVTHLNRTKLDHSPLLIDTKIGGPSLCHPFKFLSLWCNQVGFHYVVRDAWQEVEHLNPLARILLKLKHTKKALSSWGRSTLGDLTASLENFTNHAGTL